MWISYLQKKKKKKKKDYKAHTLLADCEPQPDGLPPLTFVACRRVFVRRFFIFLLAAQVTGVDSHRGLDFLLGQLHALIKHLEEFLGLVIARQTLVE
uniref:Uncharacterized protein n=1 Tax=Hippocampus comes TaxID=109280 RepID=A0A3Q2XTQ9_HIPCM